MNFVKTLFFLLVVINIYSLIGFEILNFCEYQKSTFPKRVLVGFFTIFILGFFIGFPCQFFHVSWNLYFVIMSIVYLSLVIILLIRNKDNIKSLNRNTIISVIKEHFRNYWFVYILVVIFTILSATNQLAYYRQNYDDAYYIGKMVKHIGSNALYMENYHNGAVYLPHANDVSRLINTFELTYSYFAYMFNIYVPYFARFTMVVNNYYIAFMAYVALAEMLLKDSKKAHFSIVSFSILLIASGYLMEHYDIIMYDGWQFQNAVFYGSSVVRITAIPVIIVFGDDLVKKITLRKLVLVAGICVSYISFSTIFFQIFVLSIIAFIVCKGIYGLIDSKMVLNKIIYMVVTLIPLVLLILSKKIFSIFPILHTEEFVVNAGNFQLFFSNDVERDIILKYGIIIIIIALIIFRNRFLIGGIVILLFYTVFRSGFFTNFVNLTSMNFYFVSLRTITAIQMFLLFLIGVIIIEIITSLLKDKSKIVVPILSLVVTSTIGVYVVSNEDKIVSNPFLGSGISTMGYSLKRFLNDDYMVHPVIVKVGNYFNTLANGNYRVVFYPKYDSDGDFLDSAGFVMGSRNIEMATHNGCGNITDEELSILYEFMNGKKRFMEVKDILLNHEIDYILTFGEATNELKEYGYEEVLNISENVSIELSLMSLK